MEIIKENRKLLGLGLLNLIMGGYLMYQKLQKWRKMNKK
jgi:hypothetical protein